MKMWRDERYAPNNDALLCHVEDVCNGDIKEFHFGDSKRNIFRMFVFNDAGEMRAYVNKCPHFNVPLNMGNEKEFFTSDKSQFMCSVHYAKFNFIDGVCTEGPCEGSMLESIPLKIKDGFIFVG